MEHPRSYNAVFGALGAARAWQEALCLLREMRAFGKPAPDVINHTCVIDACSRTVAWEAAVALLLEMRVGRLRPDALCCSIAMSACGHGWQWRRVLRMLHDM